ncbi:hypothetical protein KQI42_20125 [Tissierella sp. MSJ-40]|uniref:Uncharacterized protein n=1 Tax=Tissierella simiarum TaxID=2841534 RepID=A0ABS6EBT1_9FIRM|nr:hypothetical protein [Tissierella simiarum]MBU5440306.1 hypothetical protein [Tissierella simiarum]
MTIEEILRDKDINTYNKLKKFKEKPVGKPRIKLGDKIENLMRHDSYERKGRRIRQKSWG